MPWKAYSEYKEDYMTEDERSTIERFIEDKLGGLDLEEIIEILSKEYPENFL